MEVERLARELLELREEIRQLYEETALLKRLTVQIINEKNVVVASVIHDAISRVNNIICSSSLIDVCTRINTDVNLRNCSRSLHDNNSALKNNAIRF